MQESRELERAVSVRQPSQRRGAGERWSCAAAARRRKHLIAVRMANAAKEMAKTEEPGFFDLVIVNDDLEKAYAEMKKFILP